MKTKARHKKVEKYKLRDGYEMKFQVTESPLESS